MKLKKICLLLLLLLTALSPASGNALSYYYSANGRVHDAQQNVIQVLGGMYIDDQLRYWNTDKPWAPTSDDFGRVAVGYNITDYSLTVGNSQYSGQDGYLYLQLGRDHPQMSSNQNWVADGDRQWDLEGLYTGDTFFFFYNNDLPASSYTSLPDRIEVRANDFDPGFGPRYPDFTDPWGSYLLMSWERQPVTPAPVPEPASIFLLGAGLLGMMGFRKRHS